MNRSTHHSKTQYIHVYCNYLLRVSFPTHHRRGTQQQSSNNFHQSEVSCNMHHFSANCRSKMQVYWLEWVAIHFTLKMHFAPVHIRIIVSTELIFTSFEVQLKLDIFELHQLEWAAPHLSAPCPLFTTEVMQYWEWVLADLTLLLNNLKGARIASKYTTRIACIISSVYSASSRKTRSIIVSRT